MYYDLAGFAVPNQLAGLLKMTNVSHLLYGSDYPYASEAFCKLQQERLLNTELLTEQQKAGICYNNAADLLGLQK